MTIYTSPNTGKQQVLLDIASAFSEGIFEPSFPYLHEQIWWNVVGEQKFVGKDAVMANCKSVRTYFDSVTTIFELTDRIIGDRKIVITGTAQFIHENNSTTHISACDIYEWNEISLINKITSYCIRL